MKIKTAKDFNEARKKLAKKSVYKQFDSELKEELIDFDMEMKYYVKKSNIYRRFVVVRLMLIGKTVTEASNL